MSETPSEPVKASQFALRHFVWIAIGAVLLVAIGGVLIVWMPYQREQRIAREIESHGGGVMVEYCGPDWIPAAARNRLVFLNRIYCVDLTSGIVSAELLSQLQSVTCLKWLELNDTQITDAGMQHLKGLKRLESVSLINTQVTDASLAHLNGLTNLKSLALRRTKVTDAGLEHLQKLTNLYHLDLRNTQVTDAGLKHLTGLPRLKWLELNNTQVTDAGLEHLKGLTNLRMLCVNRTQVTAEGEAMLQKALPNCQFACSCETPDELDSTPAMMPR